MVLKNQFTGWAGVFQIPRPHQYPAVLRNPMESVENIQYLTFKQLNYICDANVDVKYVKDCVQLLKYEDCIFHSGVIMERDRIASLYGLRFTIAEESKTLSEIYLTDFGNCVRNLNESKSDVVGITWINGDNKSFFIFYEPITKVILGILKSEYPPGIKATEDYATGVVNSGYAAGSEKYSKGKFVRNWK
jgi:hypothetical protein